jgi:hypothetical protein
MQARTAVSFQPFAGKGESWQSRSLMGLALRIEFRLKLRLQPGLEVFLSLLDCFPGGGLCGGILLRKFLLFRGFTSHAFVKLPLLALTALVIFASVGSEYTD